MMHSNLATSCLHTPGGAKQYFLSSRLHLIQSTQTPWLRGCVRTSDWTESDSLAFRFLDGGSSALKKTPNKGQQGLYFFDL